MRILIVEDELAVVKLLVQVFKKRGHVVDVAFDGKDALKMFSDPLHDVVLLDLGLPDMDGCDLYKKIRAQGTTPIIVLTARGDLSEKIRAFDCGVDDYITKPFDIDELCIRVEAISRRGNSLISVNNLLVVGDTVMNTTTHDVHSCGKKVALTRKEYELLEVFMRNKNVVMQRSNMINHVWEGGIDEFTNTVDVHISSLRKKLKRDKKMTLETVHGVGYILKELKGE